MDMKIKGRLVINMEMFCDDMGQMNDMSAKHSRQLSMRISHRQIWNHGKVNYHPITFLNSFILQYIRIFAHISCSNGSLGTELLRGMSATALSWYG